MGEIISFLVAKNNVKGQKIFDDYVNGRTSHYLLDGYRHLDTARHKERQIIDLDNRLYIIENKLRKLKEAKRQDEVKSLRAFINAYNKGCKQAKKELKEKFPESYKQLKREVDM
jgi:hypothetical protein